MNNFHSALNEPPERTSVDRIFFFLEWQQQTTAYPIINVILLLEPLSLQPFCVCFFCVSYIIMQEWVSAKGWSTMPAQNCFHFFIQILPVGWRDIQPSSYTLSKMIRKTNIKLNWWFFELQAWMTMFTWSASGPHSRAEQICVRLVVLAVCFCCVSISTITL